MNTRVAKNTGEHKAKDRGSDQQVCEGLAHWFFSRRLNKRQVVGQTPRKRLVEA